MSRLTGKIAVITGASSGIGLAAARRFVGEGAHVYITGRREGELAEAARELGSDVTAVQGDIAVSEDLDRLFDAVRTGHGRLDVLFANAGLGQPEPLGQITEDAFDLTFGVNVRGTVFTVQKSLPLMGSGGSIILTGSTVGSMGTPALSVYSASKAAIRNLARSWALDLRGTGIRVNVLSPGATDTPGLQGVAAASGGDAVYQALIAQTPAGRIASADDVAAVALFLASDDSVALTGSEVFADGGLAQV
ncbi:SDR family NAD(P)-dependent oxidoreductase [Hephaestia mangrovi]|uniref:SDR family NAD(P)-dependent oxidoreductase n=1 Tax=Hephaestia mangrovi TaxID=2873268 RepID=UPI001CA74AF4|nr:SDR family oxidoreductase [Hephaestia mangrovi]MBY8826502.1 SDR family oxidoreductase [Hephaestia mangrovi]